MDENYDDRLIKRLEIGEFYEVVFTDSDINILLINKKMHNPIILILNLNRFRKHGIDYYFNRLENEIIEVKNEHKHIYHLYEKLMTHSRKTIKRKINITKILNNGKF